MRRSIPRDGEIPFAEKLRQQQTSSISSVRRQPISDDVHSLISGGTRSKRKPVVIPVAPNTNVGRQQVRPSRNRMRAVLAAFGDCSVKREEGQPRRVLSCGAAPSVQDTEMRKEPEKSVVNCRRLILIALIVISAFGLGKNNGRQTALRGQAMSDKIHVANWLQNTNVSVSSLEKALELFSELEEKEPAYNLRNDTYGLLNNPNHTYHHAVFPPHISHLSNLSIPYDSTVETPYFWDVHFSGESIAEAVFSTCHGLVLAAEHGLRQPDYEEEKLQIFELDGSKYVNVDMSTLEGIQRASSLGLASSHLADMVSSPYLHPLSSDIFSLACPGRMFALFRHPVDRALGMYYYLARASWDPMYNPSLAKMSITEYAKSKYIENNWVTRFLVKKPRGKLTHYDLLLAKKMLKFKCLVGLYDEMEASLARFQKYFGWNITESYEATAVVNCRRGIISNGDKVLDHPVSVKDGRAHDFDAAVKDGSSTWNAIAKQNRFDMELYEYAKRVFKSQGEEIFNIV